jgi:hypothetical protein
LPDIAEKAAATAAAAAATKDRLFMLVSPEVQDLALNLHKLAHHASVPAFGHTNYKQIQ